MKRVICINDGWNYPHANAPKKGDILEPIAIVPCACGMCDTPSYIFPQWPEWTWACKCFREIDDEIQLSELTVDELLEEPAYA